MHPNTRINPQITLLTTNHVTADKKTHALLTETAFNHQLSTKQPSNVTTITLLKHTSDQGGLATAFDLAAFRLSMFAQIRNLSIIREL